MPFTCLACSVAKDDCSAGHQTVERSVIISFAGVCYTDMVQTSFRPCGSGDFLATTFPYSHFGHLDQKIRTEITRKASIHTVHM